MARLVPVRLYAERMKRMLITGGAGFIGSHVAEQALAAGYSVTVLDNLSSGLRSNVPEGADLEVVDLRDADGLRAAVMRARPEVISHHAAQVSVSESVRAPMVDAEVNILGTLRLLEAAVLAGTRRFVFASSGGAIHGEVPEGQRASVDWPAAPISPYAVSKLAGEGYLMAFAAQHGLAYTALRYANVYGPRQNPHGEAGVVAVFADRLRLKVPLQINAMAERGDGGCVRDYVYVGDVARANLLAAEGLLPDVINIGTGVPTSTSDLAALLMDLSGVHVDLRHGDVRVGDVRRSQLDPAVCRRYLGTLTPLRDGLAALLESLNIPVVSRV